MLRLSALDVFARQDVPHPYPIAYTSTNKVSEE